MENKVTLIVPAAAPTPSNIPPTWSLRHPNGKCVLIESIAGHDLNPASNIAKIIIIFLKEHVALYLRNDIETQLKPLFPAHLQPLIEFEVLPTATKSGPETIAKAIQNRNIKGPIYVKDCDGRFDGKITPGNRIAYLRITPDTQNDVHNFCSKSFLELNGNVITNIVEKQIISNNVCVGGYGFDSAELFCEHTAKMAMEVSTLSAGGADHHRLFVSHIVHSMMLHGNATFTADEVTLFHDWKTQAGWHQYCAKYCNLLVHLEGIVIVTDLSSPFPVPVQDWKANEKTVDKLKALFKEGRTRIILTTERPKDSQHEVLEKLKRLGIPYHDVMFDMLCGTHYVVNDFSPNSAYPTAASVSVPTNSSDLGSFLPRL